MIEITRRLYQAPRDDCLTPILDTVKAATTSIRIIDYALVFPALVTVLVAKKAAGVDVRMILDQTQAAGRSEKPEVAQLVAGGIPIMVGESEKSHIIHDKLCLIDGNVLIRGSFNFTLTAELEDNYMELETGNLVFIQDFEAEFDSLWARIAAKHAQQTAPPQPTPAPPAP